MINHEKKCIFVHAPRTAGSSVERAICGNDWWRISRFQKHISASKAKEIYKDYWDDYFKFSFVRNPFDRVVSLYHMDFYSNIGHRSGKSISYFLKKLIVPPWENQDLQCSAYLDSEVDYIGRFENLKQDVGFVFDKLGVNSPLEKRNYTKHRHYSTYYTKEDIRNVQKLFEQDIQTFHYEFQFG